MWRHGTNRSAAGLAGTARRTGATRKTRTAQARNKCREAATSAGGKSEAKAQASAARLGGSVTEKSSIGVKLGVSPIRPSGEVSEGGGKRRDSQGGNSGRTCPAATTEETKEISDREDCRHRSGERRCRGCRCFRGKTTSLDFRFPGSTSVGSACGCQCAARSTGGRHDAS